MGGLRMRPILLAATAVSLQFVVPLAAMAQEEDLVFSSNIVSSFKYGENLQRIWSSLRNKTSSVNEWQFRYDPLFIPEVNEEGKLVVSEIDLPNNSFKLLVPIDLDSNKARDLAFSQLKLVYSAQVNNLQPSNIFALNVGTITISIPELEDLNIGAKLVNAKTSFLTQTNSFNIAIIVPTREAVDVVEKLLPTYRIEYNVSFNAKAAKQNVVKIKYKDLRNSTLFAALNGLGTTATYVHRDDLRKLTENIHTQIEIEGIIEEPNQFDKDLLDKIIGVMTSSVNTQVAQFDEQKWTATYHGDDLKPDSIAKSLNKEFTWDEGSKTFKFSGSVDTGGKVNVLDVLSAEGKAAGSYSQDEMQTWLKKHDIEVSFEGNKIVPKSIDLQQVNMSDFNQDTQFSSIVTLVSDAVKNESGTIDLDRLLARSATGTTIPTQVAELTSNVAELLSNLDNLKDDAKSLRNDLGGVESTHKAMLDALLKRANDTTINYISTNVFPYGNFTNPTDFNFDCPKGSIMVGFGIQQSGVYYVVSGPPENKIRTPLAYRVRCSPK
jgi:hypothetical protein